MSSEPGAGHADAQQSASIYAWEYFKFHAAQRQAVFRFYLTLIGVATLAYGYSQRGGGNTAQPSEFLAVLLGVAYVVVSFLFYRLDYRSRELVKNAEEALKYSENRLAEVIGTDSIKLMALGDKNSVRFPLSLVSTFRQIYRLVFLLVGTVGAAMIAYYLPYIFR